MATFRPLPRSPLIRVVKSRKRLRRQCEEEYEGYASDGYFGPRSVEEDEDLSRYSRYIHDEEWDD